MSKNLQPNTVPGQLLSTVPHALRGPLFRAAVLYFFVNELPLKVDTYRAIAKDWNLDQNEADRLSVVSCPTKIENLIVSEACASKFGDISAVPGFYATDRLPCDCRICDVCISGPCVCALKSWRADIDERLAERGVIVPTRDSRGWFAELWIYRNTRDQRPFPLGVRREVIA